ncbi:hypothetical protein [Asaia platycodi]|uniref:hypothetical protein n=1 Tax=Asaia platycodi TaxID=610243 RepID=UPI0034E2C084
MSRPERFAKAQYVPNHALITGASGGLGRALALHYARSARISRSGGATSRGWRLLRYPAVSKAVR